MARILGAFSLVLILCGCAGNADNLSANTIASDGKCWIVQKWFGLEKQMNCYLTNERAVWAHDFPIGLQAFDEFSAVMRTLTAKRAQEQISEADYQAQLTAYRNALWAFYQKYRNVQRAQQIEQDQNTSRGIANVFAGVLNGIALAAQVSQEVHEIKHPQ